MKDLKDLKQLVLQPQQTSLPVDFKRSGFSFQRLLLEIGFGNGEFPLHLAQVNPDDLIVGIEVSLACVLRAAARLQKRQVNNAVLIHGDARFLLREAFEDNSIDIVFMNFPCPWPKKRHMKRRVTNPSFVDTIASVLKVGGHFEVLTDEKWYATEIAESMSLHNSLEIHEMALNPSRTVTTKYERKWLEMGKNTHLIRIEKTRNYSVDRILKEVDGQMHLKSDTGKVDIDDLRSLKGKGSGDSECHWVFKDSYTDGEGTCLLETITSDSGFEQKFYFRLIDQKEGYIIKIDETTMPFRTPALKESMYDLLSRLGGEELVIRR
ncbi:MAG: tRNA (guanosine(46)-N7)-methyltransferase TrmB [Synergistales bacterium]|nr:tRNA (guanosine(46)-N7)-methyltransferase TrmB [Synergistales bacterium]